MIDININTIISQALAAAVQQAIQPLQQEYANKMAEMAQQIAALDTHLAEAIDRVAALENNPAQGADTTLNAWEMAMQNRVASADAMARRMHERVAALETHTTVLDQHGGIVEYLDDQEWFWNKIRNFTDSAVESAIEQHCEEYDHDDMVMKHELPDMDDYVQKDDLDSEVRDAVRDIMDGATVSIRL